jgi:hypothetical protein
MVKKKENKLRIPIILGSCPQGIPWVFLDGTSEGHLPLYGFGMLLKNKNIISVSNNHEEKAVTMAWNSLLS